MKDYIDVSTRLPEHPKTRELCEQLDNTAFTYLVFLWMWLGLHDIEDGVFPEGMGKRGIEKAADWDGKKGKFFEALINTGWLTKNNAGHYVLHGIDSASLETFIPR